MACNLTQGRQEVCKESIGGLAGVYFINYTTGSFTKNGSGQVTALPTGTTVYYYELKGNSSYTETVKMTTQLKLMAYGRPQIVVWTMNGDALLVGEREGADVTAGTISTGGAMGDLYGYSVTFTGQEQLPAAFLSGSTTTSPFAGLSVQPTIVYS